MSVPDDFIDAAKLDGCSHFFIYFRIVMPLIAPMAVNVALTNFFWTWNSYVWPMMISAQNDAI
jgi:multiple sugar transport system permease protein